MENITAPLKTHEEAEWYVMRDLKRANARQPAYQVLKEQGLEVFTPMVWKLATAHGKRVRKQVPFMHDLLFVYGTRSAIDPVVESMATLQYRYVRGGYRMPMKVRKADMDRFIEAVEASESPRFYTPEEIDATMIGSNVRIVGGPLNGYEGRLLKCQGSRVKRLFVELPSLLSVAVEVSPEFIQVVK